MLLPLSEAELDDLPLTSLVQRMDEFLIQSMIERYGLPLTNLTFLPTEIFNSPAVQSHSEPEIRRILYLAFSFIVQLEYCNVSGGFTNIILYNDNYSSSSWTQPLFRLRNAALNQYQIISSRIAFEIFIDLLHAIETGQRITARKSKLKAFRTWLCNTDNKFHYFAHILLEAYKFDREIRTPEVHGTSKTPRAMLGLIEPSTAELNLQHHLYNVLLNSWRPLIDILYDRRPTGMMVYDSSTGWFDAFMSGDNEEIESRLDEMFESYINC